MKKAVQDARQYEMIKSQMTGLMLVNSEEKNVHEMKICHSPNFKAQFKKHDGAQKFQVKQTFDRHKSENTAYECSKCGRRHGDKICPAKGRHYKKCNKLNHFAVECRTTNLNEVQETHSHNDQS